MQRKINYRFLLFLMMSAALLTGALFAVKYFQSQRIAQALLWQANRAEEQGLVDRVASYLKRYLEFAPDAQQERARLGQVWAGEAFAGNVRARRRAVEQLNKVLLTQPDRADLRRTLIKAALESGMLKEARDNLKELIAENGTARVQLGDAERGEVETYWGQLLEGETKGADAVAWYRQAIRHAPNGQAAYANLAWQLRNLARTENDPQKRKAAQDEADHLVDDLVARNPELAPPHLTRWRYRRQFDLIGLQPGADTTKIALYDAAQDVTEALQRAPESVEVLLAAADVERLKYDFDRTKNQNSRQDARRHLTEGLDLHSKVVNRGVHDPLQFQLLWQLTNLLLDEYRDGQLKTIKVDDSTLRTEIESRIAQLRRTRLKPDAVVPAAADYLLARLLILYEKYSQAEPLLVRCRTVLEKQPDLAVQINLHLGTCYNHLENAAGMQDAYDRVLRENKSSAIALLGMAAAKWKLGQLDESLKFYKALMHSSAAPPGGWLDIARIEVQKQLLSDKPGRKWNAATTALGKADVDVKVLAPGKQGPRQFEIRLLRAEIAASQGNFKDAAALLAEGRITATKADRPRYWSAQVELAEFQKDHEGAKDLLNAAETEGDCVDLRLARCRLRIAEKPKGEELSALLTGLGRNLDKFGSEDQARLLAGLAELAFRSGRITEARDFCKRLANHPLHQNDLRLRLFVFDLAVNDGNEAEIQTALQDIQAIEQNAGPFTHFAMALMYLRRARLAKEQPEKEARLEEAMRELDRLAELRPSWSKLFLARSEVYEMRGQPEMMIAELQNAVRAGETRPVVVSKLVGALYSRQRYKDAFDELKRAGDTLRANSDLHRFAAGLALWKEDPTTALDHARQAVAAESTNYRDLVWLGQMLELTNNKEESLAKLYRAVKLAPRDPIPYVVLVQTLAARGQEGEAKGWIERVTKEVDAKRRPLALAQCYEVVNEPDLAMRYYDEALKAQPNDITVIRAVVSFRMRTNHFDGATEILRGVISGKVEATSEADRNWARNALAIVLSSTMDYGHFLEALGLVGIQLDEMGRIVRDTSGKVRIESTEAVLTRARVLATQPIHGFRERAIELFEVLDSKQALTPNDKFIFALLYESAAQWDKAKDQMGYLVGQYPNAWQFRAQYIQLLARHGEMAQAEAELKTLEALEKKNHAGTSGYGSEELRALLLEKNGKKDEAIVVFQQIANRPGARPDRKIALTAALIRADSLRRSNEGFSLCRELWAGWPENKVKPEALGAVTVSLLRNMRPTDEQVREMERCLNAALGRYPKLTVLRLHLADLEDMRGNYAKAEEYYRDVLGKEPNDAIALNNLAWLRSQFDGKNDEGLDLINKAIQLFGRRAELLDTRALILLKMGRTDEAVAELRDAIADTPTPQRLFHLGRALHQARDRAGADKALQEAKRLGLSAEKLHPREQQVYVDLEREYRLQ